MIEEKRKVGKSAYFPVLFLSPNDLRSSSSLPKSGLILGKDPDFWSWWHKEKSVFYHPYTLGNAYTSRDRPNWREMHGLGPDANVLGDSGGFQIFQKTVLQGIQLNINPLEILRWQERNSNTGFIIDWPTGSDDSDEFYEHCLSETIKNCQFYQDNMESKELRMLKVLHGHTEDRIKKWFDSLAKFDFLGKTGWSVGFHPSSDVFGQARMFAFLHSQGHRGYFHFLGVSGWNTMPLLVYASRFMDEVVFDSSSYASGYKSKSYLMPYDMGRGDDISFGDRIQSFFDLEKPPCNCPVCHAIRESDVSFPDAMTDGLIGSHLISLHNLWLYVDRSRKLHALVADKERYHKYVHDNCSKEAYLALQYLDEVMRIGYEAATREYARYCGRLVSNPLQVHFGAMFQSGAIKPKEKEAIRIPRDENAPKKPAQVRLDSEGNPIKRGRKKGSKKTNSEAPDLPNLPFLIGATQPPLETPDLESLSKQVGTEGLVDDYISLQDMLDIAHKNLGYYPGHDSDCPQRELVEFQFSSCGCGPKPVDENLDTESQIEQVPVVPESEEVPIPSERISFSELPPLSGSPEASIASKAKPRVETVLTELPDSKEGSSVAVSHLIPGIKLQSEEPKKPRGIKKQAPKLLDLSGSTETVSLTVVVEKPECYGTHDEVCTNEFCGEHYEPCKSGAPSI